MPLDKFAVHKNFNVKDGKKFFEKAITKNNIKENDALNRKQWRNQNKNIFARLFC